MLKLPVPNALEANTYSASRNFRVSPRKIRHKPVQLVTPKIIHKNNKRISARSAIVTKFSGWLFIYTCNIKTAAAINNTPGMELSVV